MITGRVIADLVGFKCSAHFSRMFKALLQMPDDQWLPLVRAKSIAMMMYLIRDDHAALEIRHQVFDCAEVPRELPEIGNFPKF